MTRSIVFASFLVAQVANAQAPGEVEPEATTPVVVHHLAIDPLATTATWGGGLRITGLSGIGALPGVNYGMEVAALVRHDEYFAELGVGMWRPQHAVMVTEDNAHAELGLDVWTLRAGWASMKMPLRAWVLGEVGEVGSPQGAQDVIPRMMMGDTPQNHAWRAVGAGVGVAWPMTDQIRLIGNMEIAVPVDRASVMLDQYGEYKPDALAARYSLGLEVGWR